MANDKKMLYIFSAIFSGIVLLCCFVPKTIYSGLIISVITAIYTVILFVFVKKRSILKIQHRQVAIILCASSFLSIMLYYVTGTGFGFVKSYVSDFFVQRYLVPVLIVIFSSEVIRRVITSQNNKVIEAIFYCCFVVLDVLLLTNKNSFNDFDSVIEFVSLTVFPAVTANLLYFYISKRYGAIPNILYRIPISIYSYLIHVKPNMPQAMYSFIKILIPLVIVWFIRTLYEPKKNTVKRKSRWATALFSGVSAIAAILILMLVSCRFYYGALVIATESMTGAIDKGDVIIYEQYENQDLKKGQIIVFYSSTGQKTVHRISDLKRIDGELRVYTKGDANESDDLDYRIKKDIIGIQTLKIKYLGYPTVWMRELFK